MLKRIITATVLLPIVVGLLFWVPTFPYTITFIGLLVGVLAWEWSGFCYNLVIWRLVYVFIAVGLYFLLLEPLVTSAVIILTSLMWLLAIIRVLNHGKNNHSPARVLATGLIMISGCALAIVFLRENSMYALLLLLLLVWSADTLGLVVGKKWGTNKLIPQVSPGKTWEGLYGALGGSVIIALIANYFAQTALLQMIGITLLVTLSSVLGDLFISCYKRQAGLDDTGKILPGHGGLLDRVDGLLAAAPIFFVLTSLFPIEWVN